MIKEILLGMKNVILISSFVLLLSIVFFESSDVIVKADERDDLLAQHEKNYYFIRDALVNAYYYDITGHASFVKYESNYMNKSTLLFNYRFDIVGLRLGNLLKFDKNFTIYGYRYSDMRAVAGDNLYNFSRDLSTYTNGRYVLYVDSAYRSEEHQRSMEYLPTATKAGYSEHQLGLAADLKLYDTFNGSLLPLTNVPNVLKWMRTHGANYGYIERYVAGKESYSGIVPEYWHWRFVGISVAKMLSTYNLTLDEAVYIVDPSFRK